MGQEESKQYRCKYCKFFTLKNNEDKYGDCSELTFGIDEYSDSDILIDNPLDENAYAKITVSKEFYCLKFQR